MKDKTITTPTPGSNAAILQGCLCPVLDNAHGAGRPTNNSEGPHFVMNEKCPLHGLGLKIGLRDQLSQS